ncbi:hypothetical protein AE0388_0748 [Brevibacterium linens]|uniref:Uncharacterized protein n=1 Tax=Brevibacterium linens TaxID=1703 RepID=A0A0B9ADM2_BRELN|nr:hypothetical protein AE0388_0748 [Brevibacterium linens]
MGTACADRHYLTIEPYKVAAEDYCDSAATNLLLYYRQNYRQIDRRVDLAAYGSRIASE